LYEKWLERALRRGAQYADLRVQRLETNGLELRNGKIERAVGGVEEGLGLHVLVNGAWGFASTNDVRMEAFERALARALGLARAAAARTPEKSGVAPERAHTATQEWRPKAAPADVDPSEKEAVVKVMHDAVKAFKEVRATTGSYGDRTVRQEFYSSDGARVVTSLTRTVAQVHFIAKGGGRITSRRIRVGATKGFEVFREEDVAAKARQGAEATVRLLKAPAAPSGRMTVVMDPELTGVFSHEALGHASEGDLIAAGESCMAGMMGKKLGNDIVTLCDDSTVPGGFGSFPYDDQGQPGRRRVLLERGVVVGHLNDRVSAYKLGMATTGSARAESFSARPLVRMTNTYIEAGDHSFDELLEGVKKGVFAVGSRGGQVDTTKGSFQFNAQEAYLIRNGRIAHPLRDVSLTGSTLETLANIDALGKEFAWGDPGYCGKGQWVPVGDGGPHTRVRNCVVGGSA
jgi:TldD protein